MFNGSDFLSSAIREPFMIFLFFYFFPQEYCLYFISHFLWETPKYLKNDLHKPLLLWCMPNIHNHVGFTAQNILDTLV